jgi:hypothetical protein
MFNEWEEKILDQLKNNHRRKLTRAEPCSGPRMRAPSEVQRNRAKTAVSINNSLDLGPQALAGLHNGVPVEEPQHLLHLLDQILDFVERLFNDPFSRFATQKIAKKVAIRQAGWPRPPPPTPPDFIIRPARASSASFCFRRQGCHPSKRSNGDSHLSKFILQHQLLMNLANFIEPS